VPAFPISGPEPGTFPSAELALGSTTQVLRQRAVNLNAVAASEMSLLAPGKSAKALPTQSRSGSNARRNTDGWSKRGIGKENKESSGIVTAYVPRSRELSDTYLRDTALVKTCVLIALDLVVAPLRVRSPPLGLNANLGYHIGRALHCSYALLRI
jgi:hypothetical protein